MRVLAIARTNLILMLRDKGNLVTMLALPMLFIFLIGSQFGGESQPTVSVGGRDPMADAVAERLGADDAVAVIRADDLDELRRQVGRGEANLGVLLPADAEAVLATGSPLEVPLVTRGDGSGLDLQPVVSAAIAEVTLIPQVVGRVAHFDGAPEPAVIELTVTAAVEQLSTVGIRVTDTEGTALGVGGGRFGPGAAQQLVLMVFLYTLFSAVTMAQSRALGVTHRIVATPTPVAAIVAGEALGRWLVALFQGVYIMVGTAVIFSVDWGNLVAAGLTLAVFGAVGAGVGMLLGGFFDDEGVLIALAVVTGLISAALGGAMLPREFFSGLVASISRFTPHAWALDAFDAIRGGAGVADIVGELAVLATAAAVILALASWRLRRLLSQST